MGTGTEPNQACDTEDLLAMAVTSEVRTNHDQTHVDFNSYVDLSMYFPALKMNFLVPYGVSDRSLLGALGISSEQNPFSCVGRTQERTPRSFHD